MFFFFQYTRYSSSVCFLGQCFKLLPSRHVTLALMFLVFMLLLTNTVCGANVFSLLGGPLCINYDLTVTMGKQTSSVLNFKHCWGLLQFVDASVLQIPIPLQPALLRFSSHPPRRRNTSSFSTSRLSHSGCVRLCQKRIQNRTAGGWVMVSGYCKGWISPKTL